MRRKNQNRIILFSTLLAVIFGWLFFAGDAQAFANTSTSTSPVIQICGISYSNYPRLVTLSWSETKPGGTYVTMRFRAGNTATPDGTWSAWTDTANGGSLSAFNGNKYVQYEATLSSDDISIVPMLNDISITHGSFSLISSPYNTLASNSTLNSMTWAETKPGESDVVFQARTSPDNSAWTAWMGPDGTNASYFTDPGGGETMPAALRDGTGDQWIQYKMVFLTDLVNKPEVAQAQMNYNSLVPVVSSISASPNNGDPAQIDGTDVGNVTLTINGSDFIAGATVKIVNSVNAAEVNLTGVNVASSSLITATLNPALAYGGSWSVVVTNINSAAGTLTGGLTIINKSVSTSAVLDLTNGMDFSTITWADSMPSGTSVALEIRAGNTGTPDGTWTAWTVATKGQDLGSSIDGNRYAQYRATLRASNINNVSSIQDITLSYIYYPPGSFQLLGSPYNAGASDNILASIDWAENVPTGTDVKFQMRSAPDNGSGAPSWTSGSKWCGPTTCAATAGDADYASSYYNSVPAGESANAVQRDGSGDQWMQYSAWLDTSNAGQTPILSQVRLNYAVNSQPVVSSVMASQSANGAISIGYTLADTDSTSFTVSASTDLGITVADNPLTSTATTVNLSGNYSYLPTGSQTIIIENEQITCTSRSGAVLSTCTRGVNTTTANSHIQTTAVWAKATAANSSGNIGADQTADSGKSITWTIKSDFNGVYRNISQGKIRVTANDGNIANQVGNGDSSTFVIDTKDPTSYSFTINHTNNQLTLTTPTDDSSFQMSVSNVENTFTAFEAFASPYTYGSLTADPATAYVRIKDAYGNYTDTQAVTPAKPANPIYYDTSNEPQGVYQEFIAWDVISASQVGSGFSSYKVYRQINSGAFALLTTISDRTTNYYLDKIHGTDTESDPAFDPDDPSSYTYKIVTTDTNGDISAYSQTVADTPNGTGGSDSTPPTINDAAVSDINTTSAKITWTTDELSDSSVGYSEDYSYLPERGLASMVTDHEITLTGLDPDTAYHIKVKSRDASLSSNLGSVCYGGESCSPGSNDPNVFTFATHPGPAISNISASTSNYQATISWVTSTNSNTYVVYSDTVSEGELADPDEIGNPDPVGGGPAYNHSQTVTTYNDVALESGATYYFYVRSVDGSYNEAIDDNGGEFYSFVTTQDDDPPVIGNINEVITSNTQAAVNWVTDEPATGIVNYGTAEGGPYADTESVLTYDSSHYVILSGLTPNTTYYYTVTSADINTNEDTSIEYSFPTLRNPEEQHDPLSEITNVSDPPSVITDEKAVLTFTTDQPAQCAIEYGTQTGNYTEVPVSETEYNEGHSIHLSGLIFSTTYYYQITCADNLDNAIESSEYSFTTAEQQFGSRELDSTAPALSNVSTGAITGESVTVKWDTDEDSSSSVGLGIKSGTYDNQAGNYDVNSDSANYVTSHEVIINSLTPGTKYYYVVISVDAAGNIATSDESTFTTKSASSLGSIEITSTKLGEATITWKTSEKMTSVVEYGTDETYGENKESSTLTQAHEVAISGLKQNIKYHLRVGGKDASNNLYSSGDYTFAPKSPPAITNAKINEATEHEIKLSFTTSTATDALVTYANTSDGNDTGSQGNPTLTTSHELTLKNLTAGTTYSYAITAKDIDGNSTTYPDPSSSSGQIFTTGKDLNPPKIDQIRTDSALAQNDKVQAIISWVTDEPATTALIYKEGQNAETREVKVSDSLVNSHIAVITIFKPGTVYYFKVKSTDLSGNSATSSDFALLTPKRKENIIQIIVANFQDIFNWAKF